MLSIIISVVVAFIMAPVIGFIGGFLMLLITIPISLLLESSKIAEKPRWLIMGYISRISCYLLSGCVAAYFIQYFSLNSIAIGITYFLFSFAFLKDNLQKFHSHGVLITILSGLAFSIGNYLIFYYFLR